MEPLADVGYAGKIIALAKQLLAKVNICEMLLIIIPIFFFLNFVIMKAR